jgi:hypothetical protein
MRFRTSALLGICAVFCLILFAGNLVAATDVHEAAKKAAIQAPLSEHLEEACAMLDDPKLRALMDMAEVRLLVACGRTNELGEVESPRQIVPEGSAPAAADTLVNDPTGESGSSQTQSETSIALNETTGTVCSAWNDSWGYNHSAGITGFGRSTNGGASFTDGGGLGTTSFGDPALIWRKLDGKFYIATLHSSGGLGVWRSDTDCSTFTFAGQSSTGFSDDKELLAVDNNTTSAFYGRIYQAWTDFSTGQIALNHSDNGTTWTGKVFLSTSGVTVQGAWPAVGPDGTVWVAWLRWDPYFTGPITIEIKKSTNGGVSFTSVTSPAASKINPYASNPTNNFCGRPALNGNIRYLPSPQIAVTPDGVVHVVYSYDPDGFNTGDVVNVYYRRSLDGGTTWQSEVLLNDDGGTKDQWQPSLSAGPSGRIVAGWYDRRNDAGNLNFEYFQRISYDGGATWQPSTKLADVASPVYLDPGLATCYHGDYDTQIQDPSTVWVQWSDDRAVRGGHNDPDVYLESTILGPDFTVDVTPASLQVCAPANAVYTVNVGSLVGFSNPVTLSQSGAPAGTATNFSPNPVNPPGSSTMTISNTAGAVAGIYNVQVTGTSGTVSHFKTVTLDLTTTVPGVPILISPVNGATDVALTPTLTWNASTQARSYHVDVATDANFTNIVFQADPTVTSQNVSTPLQTVTQYFWRVRANNQCGSGSNSATFSFTTRGLARILLVDDDDNSPDVRPLYTGALDAGGWQYDVFDTAGTDNEPSLAQMSPYTTIIWFTGDSFQGFSGPSSATEANLATYLNNGPHCFLISSQDYFAQRGTTSFMTTYLRIKNVINNNLQSTAKGQNVFAGLGQYSLSYPFTNRSDRVNPVKGASLPGFKGTGIGAITYQTASYLTSYFGFPIEAIPNQSDRQAVLSRFLQQATCQ